MFSRPYFVKRGQYTIATANEPIGMDSNKGEYTQLVDYFFSKYQPSNSKYEYPSDKLQKITKDFLGLDKSSKVALVTQSWPPYMHSLVAYAANLVWEHHASETLDILNEHEYGDDVASSKEFEEKESWISTSLVTGLYVPKVGLKFINANGKKAVVFYTLEGSVWNPPRIDIRTAKENKKFATSFIDEINASIAANNFYKKASLEYDQGDLIFTSVPQVGVEDVILSAGIWNGIYKNSIAMVDGISKFDRYPEGIRRSLLLYGAPGVGKTQVFRALANKLGSGKCTVIWASGRSVADADDIKMLFSACRDLAPTLLFLEDVDLIGGSRGYDDYAEPMSKTVATTKVASYTGVLGELLNQLDGALPNRDMIILASTNSLNALDQALKNRPGRFDRRYELDLPNADARRRLFARFLDFYGLKSEWVKSWEPILEKTVGFTGAHIREAVKTLLINVQGSSNPYASFGTSNMMRELVAAIDEISSNFGFSKTSKK